jgi:hypothetical protein
VQLYLCKACGKTFTQQIVKRKHYPLKIILDGVSLYNLGYTHRFPFITKHSKIRSSRSCRRTKVQPCYPACSAGAPSRRAQPAPARSAAAVYAGQ